MDLEPTDRTCLETVHSDGLICEDLNRRTSVAYTPACNYSPRNNESSRAISRSPTYVCLLVLLPLCGNNKTQVIIRRCSCVQRTSGFRWNAVAPEEDNWCQLHGQKCSSSSWYLPKKRLEAHISIQLISITSCPIHLTTQANSTY